MQIRINDVTLIGTETAVRGLMEAARIGTRATPYGVAWYNLSGFDLKAPSNSITARIGEFPVRFYTKCEDNGTVKVTFRTLSEG